MIEVGVKLLMINVLSVSLSKGNLKFKFSIIRQKVYFLADWRDVYLFWTFEHGKFFVYFKGPGLTNIEYCLKIRVCYLLKNYK